VSGDAADGMSTLTVQVISAVAELRALEQQLHALFASCAAPHIGSAFPYLIADVAADLPHEPWRVYAAFRDGALVGSLFGRRLVRRIARRRLPVFQIGSKFVADPLVHEADGEAVLRRLLEALQEDQSDCAMFEFRRLTPPAFEILQQCAEEMGLPFQWQWAGYGFKFDTSVARAQFLERIDGKGRRELNRRERRLAREHASEYVREQGLGAKADMERFESFMALEDSGWKGTNETSIRRRPGYEPYFRELVRSASRAGLLTWYALRVDGRTVAMYLALRSHATLWVPKVAYDEAFAVHSPGFLLKHHVLMQCLADPAIREVNNISGAHWAQLWNPARIQYRTATLFGRSLRSRLARGVLVTKDLVRRARGKPDPALRGYDRPFL
jgi:hypothetical protein